MIPKAAFGFSTHRKTKAVFLLLLLLVGISIYRYAKRSVSEVEIMVLNEAMQQHIDSLKTLSTASTIYPFNPNFLSDQRAYFLGLSLEEIDRLQDYRKNGRWINSTKEFQQVTQVNQAWLQQYAPYFQFPAYIKKGDDQRPIKVSSPVIDLNTATAEDFRVVRGIGEVLSKRIVAYRKRLRGYASKEQLNEVYGLKPEVLNALKLRCSLITAANIDQISMQTASLEDLAQLPYLSYAEARQLIAFRTRNGGFLNWEEISKLQGFDSLKVERLALYLH